MDNSVPQKPSYSPHLRVIAGILVIALLVSMVANAAIRIRIEPGERTEAATNYLVENTDYVNEGRLARLQEKLQTLTQPTLLEDHYRLAGTRIAEEDYAGALESIEACLELDPKTDQALTLDLLMKQGCLLVLLEDNAKALEVLDQVVVLDPDHADAYLVQAQIHSQLQNQTELANALEAYMNLRPQDAQIRLVLAQTYFALEDFSRAREQYSLVLDSGELTQEQDQIRYLRALTDIQLGNFSEAEQGLLQVAEAAPDMDGIHYYIGVCQMSREAYAEAAQSMTRSIEAESMVQLSRYSRGVCGLVIADYDLELVLEDLYTAIDYSGADADPAISQQAQTLLTQLTTPPEETQ